MSKKLSFSIAVNLLTENFKKGANTVKNSLRSIQMQVITFAAALGVGGLGLSGLLSRFKDVARETNRVLTALKNVSDGTKGFADNLRFVNDLANKYGLEVNALTGNFASFTASATQANMPMNQQKKIFESLSRAATAFSLSGEQTDGVFLALSQMMSKGKISMEELRKQMGEKLPIAVQAMANALGVSIPQMEKMITKGKVMAADVLPKFADALNKMIPNVDTDNLETSINRLSNAFGNIVDASGFQNKYKALIDGLTSMLQSASKNIQNIITGIVAAIGFVVTRGLTKVYQGYAATGQQIIANATVTHNKLRTAIAARVAAEKKLEELKLKHAQAVGRAQVALAKQIEKQKQVLSTKTTLVNNALEDAKVAAARAAAIKSRGFWLTTWAAIEGSAKKLGAALKSMWNSFAPAIVVSGLITIGGYIKNLYDKTKKLEKATEDYHADVEKETVNINILFNRLRSATVGTEKYNKAKNEIINKYGDYLKGLSDEITSLEDVEGAYKAISKAAIQAAKDRAIERSTDDATNDYLKIYKRNASTLKKTLEKEFGKEKGTSLFDSVVEQLSQTGSIDKDTQALIDSLNKTHVSSHGTAGVSTSYTVNDAAVAIGQISDAKKSLDKQIEEITSLFGTSLSPGTTDNKTTTTTKDDPDDAALRAAAKRLEALRKLDEEDRKRQIEKQKFDLDLQQKAIDTLDDSFEKRTKQTILNLEKEKLAIEEFQSDLLKQQSNHAKNKYVSEHGTNKGFEAYFAGLKKNNFKDQNGIDIMPEGLRPQDIEAQVGELLDAAQNAQRKGLNDINKDLSTMLREQQLMFASDLDKKLADLDAYYNEQLIKAGNNAELIPQIEANRKREKLDATTEDQLQKLDFSEQLENERAAGLESIGMTELVEEKKLEITRKYLQLRIDALQKSANAGDKDAQQQIQMYQAALDNLDTQKPVQGLKALADKAIFNTIKKGFENAGDSAQEAEEKTISLLSAISQKAALVANITAELQDMFGGLDEGLDEALGAIGSIAEGFASGGITGGIMSVFSVGVKLLSNSKKVNKEHREALRLLQLQAEQLKHLYQIEQLRAKLEYKQGNSIFGSDEWGKARNAADNYKQSLENLQGSLEALSDVDVVTGSRKSGWGFWKKRKDVWGDLLSVYPQLINANGEFDKTLAETILTTQKLSDEGQQAIQQAIDNASLVEDAYTQMKDYLTGIFGDLGMSITEAFAESLKGTKDVLKDVLGSAGDMLENFVKDFVYSMTLAPIMEKASNEMMEVQKNTGLSDKGKMDAMIGIVGNLVDDALKQQEIAKSLMEYAQSEAEKEGIDIFKDSSATQDSTKGYSVSMDQDTGGAILGRITGMHEAILEVKSMMGAVNMDTAKCLTQSVSIGDELKKHTGIFYEMQQMQMKSYRLTENLKDSLGVLGDIKDDLTSINKNTKGLAPR